MRSARVDGIAWLCALVAVAGCERQGTARAKPEATATPPAARFAVHEWGVIEADPYERAAATSATPAPPEEHLPQPVKKPLVYLHPAAGFPADARITVTVSVADGTLREVWPTPAGGAQAVGETSHTWTVGVEADRPCGPDRVPTTRSPACTSLEDGGDCEAADLPRYLQSVPSCLVTSDGIETPVLLYNGVLARATPELAVVDGAHVRNDSDEAIGPVYVRRGGGVVRLDRLAPDAEVALDASAALPSDEAFVRALEADLAALGLDAVEAADFRRAWTPALLGGAAWQTLGFLDRATIDRMLPLTVSPAPTATVRVLGVLVR